jgi:ribosomal protein S18 acetylase RimI-like enzyme
MLSVSIHPRPAEPADHDQIASLLYFEGHVHRHLDWHTPLDWLGSPHYWTLDDRGHLLAALACPQDPPGVAWMRLFAFHASLAGPEAWCPLWESVRGEIRQMGGAVVASIVVKSWFESLLRSTGFEHLQNIVLLERASHSLEPWRLPEGVSIRPMRAEDLPLMEEIDASAFHPLWHNSVNTLEKAFSQAIVATLAERGGRAIGYQISTGNRIGGHLARLGVRKEAQGLGVGSALIGDLIQRLAVRNVAHISVNTQADNAASLALYQRMGFVPTGEQYPVFGYQI